MRQEACPELAAKEIRGPAPDASSAAETATSATQPPRGLPSQGCWPVLLIFPSSPSPTPPPRSSEDIRKPRARLHSRVAPRSSADAASEKLSIAERLFFGNRWR